MARPVKVGLSYFPLDTSFFSNEKIKTLRRRHGAIGVLTYLNILCKVYGKDGYFFKIPNGDKESFYIDIAEEIASGNDQIRQVTSRVRETIHHLLEQGILDRDLFEKDVISGIALQEQYVLATYKARQKVKIGIYGLVDVHSVMRENGIIVTETPVNVAETPVNVTLSTQSKIKEIKENERGSSAVVGSTTSAREEPPADRLPRGTYGNVFLSDTELSELEAKFGKRNTAVIIDRMSTKIKYKGYNISDCYDTILKWAMEDGIGSPSGKTKAGEFGNSFDEEEFFDLALKRNFFGGEDQ